MTRLMERASGVVGSPDPGRRNFLSKFTMAMTALLVAPPDFILRPTTAYAAVCGPAPGCNDGYTAFCWSIHRRINNCPPGNFVGGWWRAANSWYCLGLIENSLIIMSHERAPSPRPVCTPADLSL